MSLRVSQLANGLRVVSHAMPHLETVSLGVWIKAGSRDEGASENGIAHFLEHMAFKGTSSRSAFEIVEEIENVGGDLNAATGLDQTSYYAMVLRSSLDVAVSLLGDIVINPVFRVEEIAREANVIEQEIMASLEQPEDVVFDLAQGLAFPDQAVGRPVMGTRETVASFKPDDLKGFMKRHYRASQMVLCGAGALDHDELCGLAEQHFSSLPAGDGAGLVPASYTGGVAISPQKFEQAHVVAGFEGIGFKQDEIFTAQILNYTLGGGMSSRLFQEVREKRGLAYQVYGFHSTFEDTGFFGAAAAMDPQHALDVTELMFSEMGQIANKGISDVELSRAKAQLKTGLLVALESTGARAEQLARQILFFGRPLNPKDLIAEVEAVTVEDCEQLAQYLVTKGHMTVAVAGIEPESADFDQFQLPADVVFKPEALTAAVSRVGTVADDGYETTGE